MQALQPDSVLPRSPGRSFTRDDIEWVVREADGRGVPGSKGSTALIFDSREMIRRVWVFPRNWQELNANDLWAVSERSAILSTKFDAQGRDLSCTLCASLVAIQHSKTLLAHTAAAATENRAQRAECRRLAAECRAECARIRTLVESHTNELRGAGMTAEDVSLSVASAVRESVAGLNPSNDSAMRLESDTSRWCAMAYQAA